MSESDLRLQSATLPNNQGSSETSTAGIATASVSSYPDNDLPNYADVVIVKSPLEDQPPPAFSEVDKTKDRRPGTKVSCVKEKTTDKSSSPVP